MTCHVWCRVLQTGLEIAVIDRADARYCPPGWAMGSLIPKAGYWLKSVMAAFEPEKEAIILDGCRLVKYRRLVVCHCLKLDWYRVEGLVAALGRNCVTSNYREDLAEFGCGGALQPSFPSRLIGATTPSRLASHLKKKILPPVNWIYWKTMLKGRQWQATP